MPLPVMESEDVSWGDLQAPAIFSTNAGEARLDSASFKSDQGVFVLRFTPSWDADDGRNHEIIRIGPITQSPTSYMLVQKTEDGALGARIDRGEGDNNSLEIGMGVDDLSSGKIATITAHWKTEQGKINHVGISLNGVRFASTWKTTIGGCDYQEPDNPRIEAGPGCSTFAIWPDYQRKSDDTDVKAWIREACASIEGGG